jgi:hypothetical protein
MSARNQESVRTRRLRSELSDYGSRCASSPPRQCAPSCRMRGGPDLDTTDEALISENPLLGQVYVHDPKAALELLKRIKQARNGGR